MKYSDLKFDWFGEITAKICNVCKVEKSLQEFYKHKEGKYGTRPDCKICFNSNSKRKNSSKLYKLSEKGKESCNRYNKSDKHKKSIKKYRKSIKGRAQKAHDMVKYRASVIRATPKWLSEKELMEIKKLYLEAARLNSIYGNRAYHVDHIIPLNGKNICGLHVRSNLQILTFEENVRKSNKYE